jgi:hypothetical protein
LRHDPTTWSWHGSCGLRPAHVHEVTARNAVKLGDVRSPAQPRVPVQLLLRRRLLRADPGLRVHRRLVPSNDRPGNSTLLQPLEGEPDQYGVINHASWPSLRTFLPSLLLRPTFRGFVLADFAANHTAAQPILYRRIHAP